MSTTHQTYLANTAADESVPAPYQQLHRIPEPGYTAGAVEAMDAGDPKPERTVYYRVIDRDLTPRWLLFVAGVMCGAVACAWVML
jgi:hypothetical protein